MKQKLPALAGILLAAFALWVGCKEPSPLGAELLGDEFADFEYTEDIEIKCTIEREDSSLTSDRSSTAEYFLCGELDDAQFGRSRADIYTLLLGETLNPAFDSVTQVFDSLVLYLRYDINGFYGDTTLPQTLQVLRFDDGELMSDNEDYYSNNSFNATQEIGRVENFLPRPTSQDSLFEGVGGPFLRVVINPAFGQELFNLDSASYATDSVFISRLRGFKITATSNGGAIMAFDLNDNSLSRMRLYYHEKSDSTQKNFDYFFKGVNKFNAFYHDHEDGGQKPASVAIGQEIGDRIYVQGMHGVRAKLEFPSVQLLNDIAVNQAILELTVVNDETPLTLEPADQLFLTKLQGDTTFITTSDVAYSFGPTLTGGFINFGGTPKKGIAEDGSVVTRYRLTLSEEFQHFVDDDNSTDTKKRTVYLNVYPRSRTAGRVVFYGPQSANPDLKAKVKLKYTRLK